MSVVSVSNFEYTLKKYKRSKSIKLLIRANGEVLITAPMRISQKYIEGFIKSKQNWITKKLEGILGKGVTPLRVNKDEFKNNKEKARELVLSKIEKINKQYGFDFKKVFIKNQKTRWGSCSNKGNLNFSYKLALIPDHLAEYVVVHELCHLKEMNHGPNFWKLVEQSIPDYKKVREELMRIKI